VTLAIFVIWMRPFHIYCCTVALPKLFGLYGHTLLVVLKSQALLIAVEIGVTNGCLWTRSFMLLALSQSVSPFGKQGT